MMFFGGRAMDLYLRWLTLLVFFCIGMNNVWCVEKYAVLVGVSRYASLPQNRQLSGSANDVKLMQSVLKNAGFDAQHVQILADGVDAASPPTRLGILAALHNVSLKALSGDFVYLHFSGHGSQQPMDSFDLKNHETDGLDEIFLPSDIGRWDGKTATVRNAIIDNEFDREIMAIRKRGAFVWAVFDTCHAGTLSRGTSRGAAATARLNTDFGGERSREVTPQELGVPKSLIAHSQQNHRGATTSEKKQKSAIDGATNLGGFVGFYAAQSDQTTTETSFKIGDEKLTHGVFSLHLAQVLISFPKASYRQISQHLLNRYAAQNRFFPTPLFEGNGLDAPAFAVSEVPEATGQQQWRLQRTANGELDIPAGALHQIHPGAVFSVLSHPSATEKEFLSYLRAEKISALATQLIPIDYQKHAAIKSDAIPDGAYVRLVEPGAMASIQVVLPSPIRNEVLRKAIAQLTQVPAQGLQIRWVTAAQKTMADLQLVSKNERVCVQALGGNGCVSTSAWLPIRSDPQMLAQNLHEQAQSIARAQNVLRLAETFPSNEVLDKFTTTMQIQAKGSAEKLLVTQPNWPSFKAGDKLFFLLENKHTRSVDASLLFLDSAFRITSVFPYQQGEVNRIEPQGKQEIVLELTADTLGVERLIAILAEAQPHATMQDFSFLAQSASVVSSHSKVRGDLSSEPSDLHALFSKAGFDLSSQRGGKSALTSGRNAIRIFSWIVK